VIDNPQATGNQAAPEDSAGDSPAAKGGPIWSRFPGTIAFISITLLVFLGQTATSQWFGHDRLLEIGAKSRTAILSGEVWRFITPIFLHVGISHIFVNMYSLYAIGPAVERFFGTPRFMITYLLAGISGVIFSLALSPYPSAGASGAIFGMLGALAAFLYRHRGLFGRFGRLQLRQIVIVAVLNLGLGLMPGIDNWGHLGGLIAGALLGWSLGPRFEVVWVWTDQGQLVDRLPWEQSRIGYVAATGMLSLLGLVAFLWVSP
jgi:rhomboid protease GluP